MDNLSIQEGGLKISKSLILSILQEMQPSGLKDLILEIPKWWILKRVLWQDIGGNEGIKTEI